MLAQRLQWNESHTAQSFSSIDFWQGTLNVSQNPRDLQASNLELAWNRITYGGFVSLTQNIQKLEKLYRRERFDQEEVAGHTLTLLKIIRSCGTRMDSTGMKINVANARKYSAFDLGCRIFLRLTVLRFSPFGLLFRRSGYAA
jgi:hypothetical protein